MNDASAGCQACPLWKGTTQTVFGEGLKRSRLMLVGSSPALGKDFRVTRHRGMITESELGLLARFTDDLRVAAQARG